MKVSLRLYVSSGSAASLRAVGNAERIMRHLADADSDLTIVDINEQPELAISDRIVAVPTLVKVSPLPVRKVIGDLSEREHVALAFGLDIAPKGAST